MQNCEEMPTVDLTMLDRGNLESFVYVISEVCEVLAKENCITIKIIKKDNDSKNIFIK